MPGVDWIPGVSQLKATLQFVTGDVEGAGTTMKNFCRECPGVSQVTSVVQVIAGDVEGAWETQKQCLGTVNNVANGIPVVGHAKGIVHHAFGDHEGGNQALNAATRTSVVIGTGAAAAVATGGIGAIPAGIAAGVTYDAVATTVTNEDQGSIAAFKNAAKNPSAGTIFDACAIPVGDAMAGYSGGKLVAKKVTLSRLETLREAKLAEMEILAKQPGMEGAALEMSYNEINPLTSEINTIESGTPVFWDDAKSRQPAPGTSSSSAALSSTSGYMNDQNKERESASGTSSRVQLITVVSKQEDALYYDSYVEAIVTRDNKQEKKKRLQELAEQAILKKLSNAYQGVMLTTTEMLKALLERLNKDPNRNPDQNPRNTSDCISQLIRYSWLRLNMPTEFPYTGIVQLNSTVQGLYHSFIRHIDEWREVTPIDVSLTQRLAPLITEIVKLASAQNAADSDRARREFLAARQALSQRQYHDVQTALVEIQMSMHQYIQRNVTFNNFLGRSVNANGHELLYFKVKNRSGRDVVMCIAMSDDHFTSEEENGRPLRIIVTVFFMSWEKYVRRGVTETKEEMKKKK